MNKTPVCYNQKKGRILLFSFQNYKIFDLKMAEKNTQEAKKYRIWFKLGTWYFLFYIFWRFSYNI